MPQHCTICHHPDHRAIDDTLAGGTSLRTIAARWAVSKTSLLRHRDTHRPPAPSLARVRTCPLQPRQTGL